MTVRSVSLLYTERSTDHFLRIFLLWLPEQPHILNVLRSWELLTRFAALLLLYTVGYDTCSVALPRFREHLAQTARSTADDRRRWRIGRWGKTIRHKLLKPRLSNLGLSSAWLIGWISNYRQQCTSHDVLNFARLQRYWLLNSLPDSVIKSK